MIIKCEELSALIDLIGLITDFNRLLIDLMLVIISSGRYCNLSGRHVVLRKILQYCNNTLNFNLKLCWLNKKILIVVLQHKRKKTQLKKHYVLNLKVLLKNIFTRS